MHLQEVMFDGSIVGKWIILPSSFIGNPRYIVQNHQGGMGIYRYYGYHDLFITFTWNARWIEIQGALSLIPQQKPEDRLDLTLKVFKIKLCYFIEDLMKKNHFGHVTTGKIIESHH